MNRNLLRKGNNIKYVIKWTRQGINKAIYIYFYKIQSCTIETAVKYIHIVNMVNKG